MLSLDDLQTTIRKEFIEWQRYSVRRWQRLLLKQGIEPTTVDSFMRAALKLVPAPEVKPWNT